MNLRGTYTEKNLQKAMENEAMAFTKYQIYAKLIDKESKDLGDKIRSIAHNEKEHFKIWAKLLLGKDYYDNEENISNAIYGEVHEAEKMYPEFARIAREEGFDDIAEKFEKIGDIEGSHAWKFDNLLGEYSEIKTDNYFKNGFICMNCGYVHKDGDVPKKCPVCDHPREYFTIITDYDF